MQPIPTTRPTHGPATISDTIPARGVVASLRWAEEHGLVGEGGISGLERADLLEAGFHTLVAQLAPQGLPTDGQQLLLDLLHWLHVHARALARWRADDPSGAEDAIAALDRRLSVALALGIAWSDDPLERSLADLALRVARRAARHEHLEGGYEAFAVRLADAILAAGRQPEEEIDGRGTPLEPVVACLKLIHGKHPDTGTLVRWQHGDAELN